MTRCRLYLDFRGAQVQFAMLEPIRREPRFQAVVRKLNFPD